MSNDIEQKRIELKKIYRGPNWNNKVDAMSDNAIVAVYLKFKKEGKIA